MCDSNIIQWWLFQHVLSYVRCHIFVPQIVLKQIFPEELVVSMMFAHHLARWPKTEESTWKSIRKQAVKQRVMGGDPLFRHESIDVTFGVPPGFFSLSKTQAKQCKVYGDIYPAIGITDRSAVVLLWQREKRVAEVIGLEYYEFSISKDCQSMCRLFMRIQWYNYIIYSIFQCLDAM